MVIAIFDTAVTDPTVRGAGGTPDTTCCAVFCGKVAGGIDVFRFRDDGDLAGSGEEMPCFCGL